MTLPALPSSARAQLVLGAALGVFALGFWAGWESRAPRPIPPEVRAHEQAAQALDQKAEARRPALEESRRAVEAADRRVAEARGAVAVPPILAPVDLSQPAPDGPLLALVARQEDLISAQRSRIYLLEAQLADVEGANAHRAQALAAVVPQDRPRPWAFGAIWRPAQGGAAPQFGLLAHRALGPTFVQVHAFKDQVAVAAGWRF